VPPDPLLCPGYFAVHRHWQVALWLLLFARSLFPTSRVETTLVCIGPSSLKSMIVGSVYMTRIAVTAVNVTAHPDSCVCFQVRASVLGLELQRVLPQMNNTFPKQRTLSNFRPLGRKTRVGTMIVYHGCISGLSIPCTGVCVWTC
jgi:hypothetical protein